MLPTPVADHSRGLAQEGTDYQSLPNAVIALQLLGTPTARDHKGSGPVGSDSHLWLLEHGNVEAQVLALLPTPRASDGPKGGPNQRGSSGDLMLPSAVNLLPTPVVTDVTGTRNKTAGRSPDARPFSVGTTIGDVIYENAWGEYEPAIRRWESITRPAPDPTKLNAKGNPKLSDEFDEWLMGLPAGWITDVPGITWNETLKACGNGVVPQQAAAGLRFLRALSEFVA